AYMQWQRSGELIVMVLLGGTGTLYGPLLGALALLLLEETLSRLTEHWKAILGPLLVLVVLFADGGIAGAIEAWRQRRMTPAQLLAELRGGARTVLLRAERFAQGSIAAARQFSHQVEAKIGAGRLRWQAALRPRLAAMNRALSSLTDVAAQGLSAGF